MPKRTASLVLALILALVLGLSALSAPGFGQRAGRYPWSRPGLALAKDHDQARREHGAGEDPRDFRGLNAREDEDGESDDPDR